jgi:MoaA/NifB/PqqE/SkfB family radical SAM enzyme
MGRYRPVICEFRGGKYPDDVVEKRRLEVLDEIWAGKSDVCKGCNQLKTKDWSERDGRIRSVTLNHFRACNLQCAYCGTGKPENQKNYAKREIRYALMPVMEDMINRGFVHPAAKFSWGGGEPVISKEFEALVGLINDGGYRQLINTNATVFSQSLAKALESDGVACQTSVDSGTPETYRKIKGKNLFEKVWANVGSYASINSGYTLKYIVMDGNNSEEEVCAFIEKCLEHGVKSINISANHHEVAAGRLSMETIKAAAVMNALASVNGIRANVMKDYFQQYADKVLFASDRILELRGSCSS